MSSQFPTLRIADIISRIKLVVLNPRTCWESISREQPTARATAITIVAPLAILAIVCPVIGHAIFGFNVENFGLWRAPLFFSLTNQSLEITMMVTALFIDGWMLHKLAPHFYRSVSFDKAFCLIAHAAIPGFLGWALGIIPDLAQFKLLASAYGFYILFFGFDTMIKINNNAPKNNTKPAFFSCALALMLIIHIVMHGLVEPITPSPFFDILR
jgi:hypothetical protein